MIIQSLQNPKIKNVKKLLEKSRERKKNELFVVEGVQENKFALQNGFIPKEIFICEEIFTIEFPLPFPAIYVDKKVYASMALRGSTEGIIGVYSNKDRGLSSVDLPENALILIVESIEKPGNLGAILRTCDAFSVDLVVVCDEKTDSFNPQVIRSSVGCVFSVPLLHLSKETCWDFCKENTISLYSTFMEMETEKLWDIEFKGRNGLIFGKEHEGVSSCWKGKTKGNFIIPMFGSVDSLNVSNAIAISLYEVKKQKENKKT